jgi:hypothetical protein
MNLTSRHSVAKLHSGVIDLVTLCYLSFNSIQEEVLGSSILFNIQRVIVLFPDRINKIFKRIKEYYLLLNIYRFGSDPMRFAAELYLERCYVARQHFAPTCVNYLLKFREISDPPPASSLPS